MIKKIQQEIEKTEYWDMEILDFQVKFWGDEVNIFIYNSEDSSWKISFLSCYKVKYRTDANMRTIKYVKEMEKLQRGYYGQDITVKQYKKYKDFFEVSIDLTILVATIVCKEIFVEKVSNNVQDIRGRFVDIIYTGYKIYVVVDTLSTAYKDYCSKLRKTTTYNYNGKTFGGGGRYFEISANKDDTITVLNEEYYNINFLKEKIRSKNIPAKRKYYKSKKRLIKRQKGQVMEKNHIIILMLKMHKD